MEIKKRYGWVPSLPDHRNYEYETLVSLPKVALPTSVDLRPHMPPVYDQGNLGSCTANAIAGALEYLQIKKGDTKYFMASRLFIYYEERVLEGTVNSDSGAMISDGMKVVNKIGAPPASDWAYVISKFKTKPPTKAYTDGLKYTTKVYMIVKQDLTSMKTCLSNGDPIVIGFTVYDSFESDSVAKTGIVPMPAKTESVLGGHAVLIAGYDDATQRFLVRNSWGTNWGMTGYFTIPYAYFTNPKLASDLWVVRDENI